ncbi:MAG: hypothetical protein WCI51_15115 [Lentisphaerota bacterium]
MKGILHSGCPKRVGVAPSVPDGKVLDASQSESSTTEPWSRQAVKNVKNVTGDW